MVEKTNRRILAEGFGLIFAPIIVWLLITNLFSFVGLAGLNGWVFLFCLIAFILLIFFVPYLMWAPRNIFFTFVEPSTRVFVGFNGKPVDALSENGKFGGFRFVGFYPFHQRLSFTFRKWKSLEKIADGKIIIKEHPEQKVDFIYMKKYSYLEVLPEAETANENEDVTVHYFIVAQAADEKNLLFRFAFQVKDPIGITLLEIQTVMREEIRQTTYEDLFNVGGKEEEKKKNDINDIKEEFGKKIFNVLNTKTRHIEGGEKYTYIQYFREYLGLDVFNLGVIDLRASDSEIVKEIFRKRREGQALRVTAEAKRDALITETEGRVRAIEMEAAAQANSVDIQIGQTAMKLLRQQISEADLKLLMEVSPSEIENRIKECIRIATNAYMARNGAYFNFDTPEGGGGGIGPVIGQAAILANLMGNLTKKPSDTPTGSGQPAKAQPLSSLDNKKPSSEPEEESGKKGKKFSKEVVKALEAKDVKPDEELEYYIANDDFTDDGLKALIEAGIDYGDEKKLFGK